ncbi:putative rhamnosyl transferase [Cribrihabitans sp. XS_ASV171]
MQVLGLCRFSYLGRGGFKVEHESLDERRTFLYDPARMEERFRYFEAITLPSVRAQTDPDFTFLIATGECFPVEYMARLEALTADIPQVVIRRYKPMKHRQAMARALKDARIEDGEPHLQFRLDDDDAMGVDFVERFRRTARDLRPLWDRHPAIAVDFNTGYVFRAGANGLEVVAYKYPYSAIALGVILQPGVEAGIMHHGHHKLWTAMPTITFPGEDMMLRGHNDFNDSRMKGGAREFDYQPLSRAQEAHFRARFGIDNDRVRAIFSGG